jgi:hypothetical protein
LLERVEGAIEIALYHPLEADDCVHIAIDRHDKRIESAAAELPAAAQARASFVVAHRGEQAVARALGDRIAAFGVFFGPRFAAFLAHNSAHPPEARGDVVDQDAFAGGFGLELFEEGVEERVEFFGAGGAVELKIDDVAGVKSVREGIVARGSDIVDGARSDGFRCVGALGGELLRREGDEVGCGSLGRGGCVVKVLHIRWLSRI